MKKLIYFFVVTILVLSSNVFAQWSFVGGVTGIAGQGESPSISVCSPTCAWVATGSSGTTPLVSRTTNGGVTWTATGTTGLAAFDLFCCWAVDSLTCYVGNGGAAGGAGGNATFYKTTNGGTSWTAVASTGGTGGFFNGIVFGRNAPNFGVAQSDPITGLGGAYYINTTTNGGANWNVLATPPPGVTSAASAQNSIFVNDASFFGFGVSVGTAAAIRFYMTTNGGANWLLRTTALANGTFTPCIAFGDNKLTGVVASSTSLPNIARTTDGGATFTNIATGVTVGGASQIKWMKNSNTVYMSGGTGASGCVMKSTNGGLNWTVQSTSGLAGITSMDILQNGNTIYGYAICADGSVLKINETITGVENPSTIVPSNYSLEQNFPNPFNPTTTINYSLPVATDVSLKVYDALGNEVMSLVNGFKNAGTHSITMNASELTSGIYFYKLQAGNFVATKKLTLIK